MRRCSNQEVLKKIKPRTLVVCEIYLLILLLSVLTACRNNPLSYQGATAKPDSRIDLMEGGPHEGRWQTRDLSLDYRYQLDANTLQLSGVVELENHLKYNFAMLENLRLWVNYLNIESKVLDYKIILMSDYRQMVRTMKFSHHLTLPPDTTQIAFSYSGRAIDAGSGNDESGGNAADWDFEHFPQR